MKRQSGDEGSLYLDHTLVLPGDVLLERGTSAQSAAIALATDSAFSHASILVNGLVALEALDDGVLATNLEMGAVRLTNGKTRIAVPLAGDSDAVLLRHTALDAQRRADAFTAAGARNRHDIADEILGRLEPIIGQPYASTAQLLRAASSLPLRTLGAWLAERLQGDTLAAVDQGIFCSELVARAYEALELPLFDTPRLVGRVNPGDLAASPYLVGVAGAIFHAEPVEPDAEQRALLADWKPHSREEAAALYRTIRNARKRS